MIGAHPTTVYVDSATHVELRPPKNGRKFLEVNNMDAAVIYYSEDTFATAENALQVAANSVKTWAKDGTAGGVPQGSVWILGSAVAGTRQRVIVREG